MYLYFAQKVMDIQSKLKDAMYPSNKTQLISKFSTIKHNFVTKLN